MDNELCLGCEAIDDVTGIQGALVSFNIDLGGSPSWQLQPKGTTSSGNKVDSYWVSEDRLSYHAPGVKHRVSESTGRKIGFLRESAR